MKKILITGANSYIGVSFENYIKENFADKYSVDTVDMIDGIWKEKSFSAYDAVFHVAGIAHQKETAENAELYYTVNRDLAIETARKAKADGVKQFVFLSSMSIYGMDTGVITRETAPDPKSNYGKSKLQAEEAILKLADNGEATDDAAAGSSGAASSADHAAGGSTFKVCILRPPMVYGKGCKGNFRTVVKLVEKSPVFPKIKNQRSMIYIENLCSFVEFAIDRRLEGVYFPQNREYVQTTEMAKAIALKKDKTLLASGLIGLGVRAMSPFSKMIQKAFGTLIYKDTECFGFEYCRVDNAESFERSV